MQRFTPQTNTQLAVAFEAGRQIGCRRLGLWRLATASLAILLLGMLTWPLLNHTPSAAPTTVPQLRPSVSEKASQALTAYIPDRHSVWMLSQFWDAHDDTVHEPRTSLDVLAPQEPPLRAGSQVLPYAF